MDTIKKTRARGRPRRFDPDAAVATAQQLFHAHGYDAVSVADVTAALGINPPSFYAAFGNKVGLYSRILERWAGTGAIPLHEILRPDRPTVESLSAVLEEAARRYAANPDTAGCLVIEGTRCNDPEARAAATAANQAGERLIEDYIALRHPKEATQVADFVSTTLSGLSAKARNGYDLDRLLATAKLASLAVEQVIHA
jgi:TetR/AcrR family transcriptional regulator, repressor for divergent bdcA